MRPGPRSAHTTNYSRRATRCSYRRGCLYSGRQDLSPAPGTSEDWGERLDVQLRAPTLRETAHRAGTGLQFGAGPSPGRALRGTRAQYYLRDAARGGALRAGTRTGRQGDSAAGRALSGDQPLVGILQRPGLSGYDDDRADYCRVSSAVVRYSATVALSGRGCADRTGNGKQIYGLTGYTRNSPLCRLLLPGTTTPAASRAASFMAVEMVGRRDHPGSNHIPRG